MGVRNVVLIGMPGSGKSTVGVILAKALGFNFLDTDIAIQNREKKKLQEIVNSLGNETLRKIEAEVCGEVEVEKTVISTGGSVVYSPSAMESLRQQGPVVWLHVSYENLLKRIDNFETRGLAKTPGQTLEDLFNERSPLYEKYSQVKINNNVSSPEEVVNTIIKAING